MNNIQVQDYIMRYLEATKSHIIERKEGSITVKLSPEADRALTNRSYYWSFVERTGAEPETMTYTFVFNPTVEEDVKKDPVIPAPPAAVPDKESNTILGRYFGITPNTGSIGTTLNETVTYGSRRLDQFFQAAKSRGKYVHLFEEPRQTNHLLSASKGYFSWFAVNYNVSLACDMKRDELHSLGISLSSGEIVEDFHQLMLPKQMTPKLLPNTHIRNMISMPRALNLLENHLEKRIRAYDHGWATEAQMRLQDELLRMDIYYRDIIQSEEDETKKAESTAQYENRKKEIEWQYRPRIQASFINCGLFHLYDEFFYKL